MTDKTALGPHVDSHTFECQMVTYLGAVGDDSGGFTCWPGSHEQVYHAHDEALNWNPTDSFPGAISFTFKAVLRPFRQF